MCYSAMVEQDLKKYRMKWNVRIDISIIEEMYKKRALGENIKISKAFDANFLNPESVEEKRIKKLIDEFNLGQEKKFESEIFKQKKRLADAERALQGKQTKKALEEQRIASTKIKHNLRWLENLKRKTLVAEDSRVFPMHYAPIVVQEKGEFVLKLARYHCRPSGKPAEVDYKYNGLYNARTDNLGNAFWKPLFGQKHGFFVVQSFYENVARHNYEKRDLRSDEKEENVVLQFIPPKEMYVACLYDFWDNKGSEGFYSFAALTGEPTKEISEAGHDRLIIALKEKNISSWLNPHGQERESLMAILSDSEQLHYEHEMAG